MSTTNRPQTDAHIAADGLLASRCWCQATDVRVTPADVRNGRTGTCGADQCDPGYRPPPKPAAPRRTRWAILDTQRRPR